MSKKIKLSETQLKKVVQNLVKENMSENYMFFSNLEQIKRQCEMLLELDKDTIDQILEDGHDWADDHISEAKTNIDQVFDFMMNTIKGGDNVEDEDVKADVNQFSVNEEKQIDESKNKPTNPKLWSQCLAWARSKYKVCPSAYCNGAAAKRYKSKGGGWRKSKS